MGKPATISSLAPAPETASRLLVGYVGRSHGVVGEVKMVFVTDNPDRLCDLEEVFVGFEAERASSFRLQSFRMQQTKRGTIGLIKLEGIDSRESADALRRQSVFVDQASLPPLAEDEYFFDDLVGLSVYSESGERIGLIKEVLELPAHELLVVQREDGRESLFPAVSAFLKEVDVANDRLVIRLIEGLLDL